MLTLNPYLSFTGEARAAMEFYRSVFGGELTVDTFGSFGGTDDPDDTDLVMHAQLETPQGFTLMASDTPSGMRQAPISGFSVSISGDDEAAARSLWAGLSDGGTITMPLEPAPWGGQFGMLTDQFGVAWLVSIDGDERGDETGGDTGTSAGDAS